MDNHLVTVIIPVFNGMPHIKTAIKSILNQTYKNLQVLIIDDGSIDNTKEFCKSITDRRVTLIIQEHRGLGATLNGAIKICNTKYLVRMDADDFSCHDRIEKQIAFLNENKEVGCIGCQIEYFYLNPENSGFPTMVYQKHEDIYKSLLRLEHGLTHATLVFRTDMLRKIGGYRISGVGEDWDLFLRIGEVCRLANLKEYLYKVRISEGSVTWTQSSLIRLNNSYAADCAKKRLNKIPEKAYDDFKKEFKKRSIKKKTTDYLDTKSLYSYKKSIILMLSNRKLSGILLLFLACLLNPMRMIRRIVRIL